MDRHIRVGKENFKTKISLTKHVQALIEDIGLCSSLINEKKDDAYNFFMELFKRHPNYPVKTLDVVDIAIVPNKVTPNAYSLNIKKTDGSVDDISWVSCVSGVKNDPFKSALRIAVEEQTKGFRRECAVIICEMCKSTSADKYEVDHINHFEEILYEFMQTTEQTKPTKFKNHHDGRKAFTSDDIAYEMEWKAFHERNARLRLLCSTCNQSRPKWKKVKV